MDSALPAINVYTTLPVLCFREILKSVNSLSVRLCHAPRQCASSAKLFHTLTLCRNGVCRITNTDTWKIPRYCGKYQVLREPLQSSANGSPGLRIKEVKLGGVDAEGKGSAHFGARERVDPCRYRPPGEAQVQVYLRSHGFDHLDLRLQ